MANFDGTFYIASNFNQDITSWNVTSGTNFNNMFQQMGQFNQDIRKWDVRPGASFTHMFLNNTAMTATYGTHPYYSRSPRREFFYAAEVATLEDIAFPKNSRASINFQRNTVNYNVTIFDEKGIEIRVRVTEFDNVGHPNATVSIGESGPLVLDAQGYATHTVPVTMTRLVPNQTVRIVVTSPDGSNVVTYTLNLSTQVIDDTNITPFVADCLAEDPVGGICPIWASGAGVPTMPNWDVSDVTYMAGLFQSLPNFNADITKWDTSNVVNLASMFADSTSFNQDLREWPVKWNAFLTAMFIRATAFHATFAGTTYFADTPRESFFYAFDTDTLENVSFPNDPSIVISFNRRTRSYNLTVPDKNSIDISLGVSDFSNVNGQTATVTVDTNPVALDSQGKGLYTLPITATFGTTQVVTIDVTASDGVTVGTYTFNLTVDFLTNANIAAAVNACLAEAPATGNCPVYAATSGRPVMSNWNVSNVTDMSQMFAGTRLFNQDIGGWTVTIVSDMSGMFNDARAFNQNIGPWRPQNLTIMGSMFESAHSFNQDISQWDVSTVQFMNGLFYDARVFNQDVSLWDVSNVRNMGGMFAYSPFNHNIGGWDVGNVTSIGGMFQSNGVFNQDISRWNTSNMISMGSAFEGARFFSQDINTWDTSKVTSFDYMFKDVQFMNADLRRWEVGPTADNTDADTDGE